MATIRVLIADDQRLFREAAQFAMAQHRDLALAAESELAGAVPRAAESKPDVAVVGFGNDASRGECLRVISGLREQLPDCPVAAFFELDEEDLGFLVRVLELEASGFISRRCSGAEFVTALRWLYYGGVLMPRPMFDEVASALLERRIDAERTIRLDEPRPHETRSRSGRSPTEDELD